MFLLNLESAKFVGRMIARCSFLADPHLHSCQENHLTLVIMVVELLACRNCI